MIFVVFDYWLYIIGVKFFLRGIDNFIRSFLLLYLFNKFLELFLVDVSRNCRWNNNRVKLMIIFFCCNDMDNDLIRDLVSIMSVWW